MTYNHTGDRNTAILLLNWNGWIDTVACLKSLYRIDHPHYDVVVIDNGSSDGSVDEIKKWAGGASSLGLSPPFTSHVENDIKVLEYDREQAEGGGVPEKESQFAALPSRKKLTIIKNHSNLGFAAGNNVGIRYAMAKGFDYLLLLNNDTIVDPGFLSEMLRFAGDNTEAGIIGPLIYYLDRPGYIWSAGASINWWLGKTWHRYAGKADNGQADTACEVDYVSGCALLIKRRVVEDIGLLDPDYYFFFEDTDWCKRAAKKGHHSYYVPEAKLWHKVSATSNYQSDFYNYYFSRNRIFFFRRYGTIYQRLLLIYPYQFVFKSLVAFFYFGLKNRSLDSALVYARGCRDGLKLKLSARAGLRADGPDGKKYD